jgi:ATP-dependent helicase HepA
MPVAVENLTPGQRFVSDAEPELGLGMIIEVDHRSITLAFAATGTTRQYAFANAPLTRISFDPGEMIRDASEQLLEILKVAEQDGLILYRVVDAEQNESVLPETSLSPRLGLSQPLKRLLAGQTESGGWAMLRRTALETLHDIESSPLLGLYSGRTDLLPHQLYIANEVARRRAPRVLLSDEVGLGKTIEACLVLQQQLFSGLVSRVLVVVPETLVHQWLVELLRRFNLQFTILDSERCEALTEQEDCNPFESAQLVLCSRSFLEQQARWQDQALATSWDMLIIDEAHQLLRASRDDDPAWQLAARLAAAIPAVLLLTATPDQSGLASSFRLLQLLDPGRFHDLDVFLDEQQHYHKLAALLDPLQHLAQLDAAEKQNLVAQLAAQATDPDLQTQVTAIGGEQDPARLQGLADSLLGALLDRHGTGRIVFRNTRRNVSGFPQRQLQARVLAPPELYAGLGNSLHPEEQCPETEWLKADPRLPWLVELLKANRRDKFLLICHNMETAEALETWLQLHRGIPSAVFHENLTIVERDRAAAWFADPEEGAQILVCSEIGSEGRNFQFCRHLVMFDLPRNPDLLEQRIGRLDRIGQQHQIQIHVPCFAGTVSEILLDFHHRVLDIFSQPNPVAAQVEQAVREQFEAVFAAPDDQALVSALFDAGAAANTRLAALHAEGRDRLLELNSCRPAQAEAILSNIRALEQQAHPGAFLQLAFENFGLDCEENTNGTWNVRLTDDMLLESFPLVPDDGLTFTLDRPLALTRDDLPFVNWLHPLVLQTLDLILQQNNGKAFAGILRDKRLPQGTLVLECNYRVTVSAPPALQASRWFPATLLRSVVDSQKRSIGKSLTAEQIDARSEVLDRTHLRPLLNDRKPLIQMLATLGKKVVEKQLPDLIDTNTAQMVSEISSEIARLRALQQVNPQVSPLEIEYLEQQQTQLQDCYAQATMQLESLRLLLVV